MWDAIILGQVPGTTSRLSYAAVLSLALLLLMLVLVRSVARRRSSWYWRVYAEMELYGVEDELFPYSNDAGRFENPFVRAELRRVSNESKRRASLALVEYFHRTVAVLRAGTAFRVPGQPE